MSLLPEIESFLHCPTPSTWIQQALQHPEILLIDHANCEKKAAGTALTLLFRYVDKEELQYKLSRLAREELRHFEQVATLMKQRGVLYRHLSAAHYAQRLRQHIRTSEPGRLVDTLIIGAYIEARSCERFYHLAPHLDKELREFYLSLLESEGRHYRDYLGMAEAYANEDISERVLFLGQVEKEAIQTPDTEFRFHSGAAA